MSDDLCNSQEQNDLKLSASKIDDASSVSCEHRITGEEVVVVQLQQPCADQLSSSPVQNPKLPHPFPHPKKIEPSVQKKCTCKELNKLHSSCKGTKCFRCGGEL